ncbi:hypothetical protein HMI56_000829 [Coelomomyces lativittatus]|nr:hypothetical protein HMI56_000829 [Coelomomyces lativittatus]
MSSLAKQSQDFLRKLAHQPVFGKPVIPPVNPSSSTSRPFYKHGFKPPGKKLPTLSVAIQAALITILDYLKVNENPCEEREGWIRFFFFSY